MPKLVLASTITRWLKATADEPIGERAFSLTGSNVREVLNELFQLHPNIRGYLLDDQQALRHHVVIFRDGEPVRDKQFLAESVNTDSEIYVFQALSGG